MSTDPASVSASGMALKVQHGIWRFSISRVDGKRHNAFYPYHGEKISPHDVSRFVPNWRTLAWIAVPNHALAAGESHASDKEFEVTVSTNPASSMSHRDVVDGFLGFMHQE